MDAGIIVLASFISPLKEQRKMIQSIIGETDFVEIFVDTSLEECERRDVKGLYKKARQGELKNFTGIDAPYERPENPTIHIRTEGETEEDAAGRVVRFVRERIGEF